MISRRKLFLAICLLLAVAVTAAAGRSSKELWQAELASAVRDAVLSDGRLFVSGPDGVRCLNAANGKEKWALESGADASLAADKKNLWLLTADTLRRIDAATGRETATVRLDAAGVELAPAPFENRLLLETAAGSQLRDAASLKLIYQSPEPLFGGQAPFLRQSGHWRARLDDRHQRVFFVENGQLRAVDAASGNQLFTSRDAQDLTGWPTVREDRVFVLGASKIHCFATEDGDLKWESRYAPPDPVDPLILTPRINQSATLDSLPWYQRWWKRAKRLTGADFEDLLTVRYARGLAFHFIQRGRQHLLHPLPDEVRPLIDDGRFVFWLYTYTDESDGEVKSVLMRHDKRKKLLYGRSAVKGRASGFVIFGANRVWAELSPGRLYRLSPQELEPQGSDTFPGDELATLLTDGKRIIAVSRQGLIRAYRP